MSAATSPATSQSYGVQRVCRIWGLPRSSFYHASRGVAAAQSKASRGPVPPVPEDSLLAAIRADLAASPFRGEGHRKVWARLRYGLGLVVGRNRVLRLMHENQLLSPYRQPPRPANDHNGTILTTAPDRLWGTDASMVQTVTEGRVWVFAALDHFNSEVVGHYVSTDGSRFAALEPVSQAVTARFGGVEADAARGVTVRADNGPQYISRHFTRQLAHWGMALSHSFPHQPETNGVAERFFRTLKEQVIYGRIFHTAAEVRTAVATFVTHYNASWRLARLGYSSPLDYRARHTAKLDLQMAA
jgi:putative transposase